MDAEGVYTIKVSDGNSSPGCESKKDERANTIAARKARKSEKLEKGGEGSKEDGEK